jgi:EAL domain-containing protein (putative c-di-GMP-specific phosphodiesterase class I)
MLNHSEHTKVLLNAIKDLDFSISLDDFGTGYSSLAYIKRFPIDCIKIDRSFIKNIPNNDNETATLKVMIALTEQQKQNIVVEGVKTKQQQIAERLKQ